MNKVKAKDIIEFAKTANQAFDGSFSEGSKEHQDAAKYIEEYFLGFTDIKDKLDDPKSTVFAGIAICALRDVQVRDYALGLMNADNINTMKKALTYLVDVAPEGYESPAMTLLSITYYETGEMGKAIDLVSKADPEYSMASLLKRVYSAGWPKESFAQMRDDLHPKVVATIFGEDE